MSASLKAALPLSPEVGRVPGGHSRLRSASELSASCGGRGRAGARQRWAEGRAEGRLRRSGAAAAGGGGARRRSGEGRRMWWAHLWFCRRRRCDENWPHARAPPRHSRPGCSGGALQQRARRRSMRCCAHEPRRAQHAQQREPQQLHPSQVDARYLSHRWRRRRPCRAWTTSVCVGGRRWF